MEEEDQVLNLRAVSTGTARKHVKNVYTQNISLI